VAVDGGGGVAAVAAAVRKVVRRRIGRMSVHAAAPPMARRRPRLVGKRCSDGRHANDERCFFIFQSRCSFEIYQG